MIDDIPMTYDDIMRVYHVPMIPHDTLILPSCNETWFARKSIGFSCEKLPSCNLQPC